MSMTPLCAMAAPYELRVYSDDIQKRDETEVELITSVAQPKSSDNGPHGLVRQTLVEFGRGLGNGWTIGLELPMSNAEGHNKINGLKTEVQYVAEHEHLQGLYWGLRGDVGYACSPYEAQGSNSVDINPIFGYRWSSWHLVVNPSVEIPLSGSNRQAIFQPSAKIAHDFTSSRQLGLEYFSNWGAMSSVLPRHQRDETLYVVWDEMLTTNRWNFGLGKPMNPSGGSVDKWVIKVGLSFEIN